MKSYTFTRTELEMLQDVMDSFGEFAPREAFRVYHKLSIKDSFSTEDVEDFIRAFMAQYNKQIKDKTY